MLRPMPRITRDELDEMRRLATMGYLPFFGSINSVREADPVIPFKRSQISEYQNTLLRAIAEIERCYAEHPPE